MEGLEWTEVTKEQQEQFASESVDESIVDYSNTVIYRKVERAYRATYETYDELGRSAISAASKGSFKPEGYEVSLKRKD